MSAAEYYIAAVVISALTNSSEPRPLESKRVLSQTLRLFLMRLVYHYFQGGLTYRMGAMTIDFKGVHYPKAMIFHAVFFYVRYAVSYLDLEEILARAVSKLTMRR